MIKRASSLFAIVLPLVLASCGSGGSTPEDADPKVVAACNAACETFLGGDCYGACKATCGTPFCTIGGDVSTYENVIALHCSDTLNFITTDGSSSCSSPDIPAPGDNGSGTSHRMFVTSARFSADLAVVGNAATGPAGADNLCNLAAQASSLGGTWKAWISDSTVDAIDRIEDKGPWLNVTRTAIVFPNKAALTQLPLDTVWYDLTDEKGDTAPTSDVWTGTKTGGRVSSSNGTFDTCDDWTMMGEFTLGSTGSSGSTASIWTDWLLAECQFTENRLYCIEQ